MSPVMPKVLARRTLRHYHLSRVRACTKNMVGGFQGSEGSRIQMEPELERHALRDPVATPPLVQANLSVDLPMGVYLYNTSQSESHAHSALEFQLVVDGQCNVNIDGSVRQMTRGDVALIHPNQTHQNLHLGQAALLLVVKMEHALIERVDPDFANFRFVFNETVAGSADYAHVDTIRTLLATIFWESETRAAGWLIQAEAAALQILAALVRNVPHAIEDCSPPMPDAAEATASGLRLRRIAKFVESHADEHISHTKIAHMEGITVEYLCRLFKTRTNKTFKKYVTDVRLARSLNLLAR